MQYQNAVVRFRLWLERSECKGESNTFVSTVLLIASAMSQSLSNKELYSTVMKINYQTLDLNPSSLHIYIYLPFTM